MRLRLGTTDRPNLRDWISPLAIGALAGLVAFLLVLVIRAPRDTIVLEVSRQPGPDKITVWVGGEVAQPGLYQLQRGSRVADAVEAAGGLELGADTGKLAMAAVLNDADEVIVPPRQPAAAMPAPSQPVAEATGAGQALPTVAPQQTGSGLININTADATALETLPGIGPVLAQRIITYREENGGFSSVDELEVISGISARMVDEFRPLITAGE